MKTDIFHSKSSNNPENCCPCSTVPFKTICALDTWQLLRLLVGRADLLIL